MARSAPIVLLIDDHADTRDLYAQILSLSGFSVWEAEDGAAALAKAVAGLLPSVVVTDLRMPGLSASELCRRFAERGVPVVALTGVGPGHEHEEMRAAGCAAIIIKPVTPDKLIEEVRRILRRGPAEGAA
jgi:two-component system cell cycle response regulator DivK